jgi:hypothetical protein
MYFLQILVFQNKKIKLKLNFELKLLFHHVDNVSKSIDDSVTDVILDKSLNKEQKLDNTLNRKQNSK